MRARTARRRGTAVIVAWVVAAAVLAPAAAGVHTKLEVAARVHGSESAEVERRLAADFGSPFARYAVLVLEGVPAPDSPAGRARLAEVTRRLGELPGVAGTLSWLDLPDSTFLPAAGDGTFVIVGFDPEAGAPDALIPRLRAATPALTAAAGAGARLSWTGEAALNHDIRQTSSRAAATAELRALPLTLVLLLVAFGAVAAALVPVAAGLLAITAALGAAGILAGLVPLSIVLENVASMIGLGLGIDYGLLTVSRFREALAAGRSPVEAAREARRHAGHTIVVSGLTVAIGFAALLVVPLNEIRSVAVGGLLVTAASVLVATTLLPALLARLGHRVDFGRLDRRRRRRGAGTGAVAAAAETRWRRWGVAVTRHPVPTLVLAAAPLVALAAHAPRLSTELPRGDWLPASMESARGLTALEAMGRSGVVRTLRVVVALPEGMKATDPEGWAAVAGVARRLEADPRVRSVQALPSLIGHEAGALAFLPLVPERVRRSFVARDGAAGLVEVVPREEVPDAELGALVRELRTGGAATAGARLLVGGLPALNVDYQAAVGGRLVLVLALVLGTTLLGLAVAFGSVLVPLKAVALNLLTVGAAMGALVLVFQDGHGAALMGLDGGTGGVFAAIPILVFCTVFGLSMDYEVFLVARVAEARRAGRGEAAAIVEGVARTGRVITSAAAIMVVVFGAFAVGDFLLIRMLGFALATAVLLDATLVRMAVAPALLALAGRWNWWPGRRGEASPRPAGRQRRITPQSTRSPASPAGWLR